MTTVDLDDAGHYTEATIADTYDLHDAPRLPMPQAGTDAAVAPTLLTIRHEWRTQLGHTWWTLGNITVAGRWVTDDGSDDPRFAIAPTTTVILGERTTPDWIAAPARRAAPANLRLVVPFHTITPVPTDTPDPGPSPLRHRNTRITVEHTVWGIRLRDADIVEVGDHPTDPRHARADRVGMTYRQNTDGDRTWHLKEVTVVGPWTTADGDPHPHHTGTAAITLHPRPDWLTDLITHLTPDPALHGLHDITPAAAL